MSSSSSSIPHVTTSPSRDLLWSLSTEDERLKTILILGGSYGGLRAARVLTDGEAGKELAEKGWRVVVVDRNDHFNRTCERSRERRGEGRRKREVTLLHSREQLLNRFDPFMHEQTKKRFDAIGVNYHLGERAIIPPEGLDLASTTPKIVTTTTGRQIPCDIILMCNGQTPLSHHLICSFPTSIDPATKLIRVSKTTQIVTADPTSGSAQPINGGNMFAIGDCCFQQDVIMAGYTAYNQGTIAAQNILKLISHSASPSDSSEPLNLDEYEWEPPAIKLTLGLKDYVIQTVSDDPEKKFKVGSDGEEDLGVEAMWKFYGVDHLPRSA